MPRINAPTVAEHHANQQRAILDAARGLLAETGQAPSMAAVGRRAGLARSSVYQYFDAVDDLVAAVVADVLPDWAARVLTRVAAESTPARRVWAYVEANVELFASSEQDLAQALTRVVAPDVLRGPLREFHAQIQQPLREALADFGEPEPDAVAELVDTLVITTSRSVAETAETTGSGESAETTGSGESAGSAARATALSRLGRLLHPYLGLDAGERA